jgi:DNA polymerase V
MPIYALVDANNFYATCEKVFNPALSHTPLVVLSNNDGCIVARSAEAKVLGIPMGAPMHEWRDFCTRHGVLAMSSNYTLYGDISARMLSLLQDLCPEVESYSIDESFLKLDSLSDSTEFGQYIRAHLQRCIKVTCGVGIGPTKTLSKFANHLAKKRHEYAGVFNCFDHSEAVMAELMAAYPTSEIWGVGRRLSKRLAEDGIATVLDLAHCDAVAIRQRYGIVLEKTVRELRGESCLSLEDVGRPKEQIMASRSFAKVLSDPQAVKAAVSSHLSRAAEKLRAQESVCTQVYVMLRTNPFRTQDPQYRQTALVPLPHASADTAVLMSAAMTGLKKIFLPGFRYQKCGVMLGDISPTGQQQGDLFAAVDDPKRLRLMSLMDSINKAQGSGTLHMANTRLSDAWQMRNENKSPYYTTCWDEFPVAYD